MAALAQRAPRRIVADGTPESRWQAWPALQKTSAIALDELVPPGVCTVIVAPHPDDEVLAFGGLIAMLAARARPVRIVAVTDGEASHPGSPVWTPERLARQRRQESLEGLRRLGCSRPEVHRLGFGDGAVARHQRTLGLALAGLLEPGDRVFTTWAEDGHPDHEATARAVDAACRVAGAVAAQSPVWMWHWAEPGDKRVPWQRLRRLRLDADALARKRAAIAAHVTQLTPQHDGSTAVLSPPRLQRLMRTDEYVFAGTGA